MADDLISPGSSGDETLSSLTDGGRRPVLPASSRGLDFISSSNAHIVFGNDIDADPIAEEYIRDESSDDEDADQSSSSSDGSIEADTDRVDGNTANIESKSGPISQAQIVWTVLYIQMEYCRPEVGFILYTEFEARRLGQRPSSIKHQVLKGSIRTLRITVDRLPVQSILALHVLIGHFRLYATLSTPGYKPMLRRVGGFFGKSFKD